MPSRAAGAGLEDQTVTDENSQPWLAGRRSRWTQRMCGSCSGCTAAPFSTAASAARYSGAAIPGVEVEQMKAAALAAAARQQCKTFPTGGTSPLQALLRTTVLPYLGWKSSRKWPSVLLVNMHTLDLFMRPLACGR